MSTVIITPELETAIQAYCDAHSAENLKQYPTFAGTNLDRTWSFEVCKKFVKVTKGRKGVEHDLSVHCFIQIADEGKWKAGDIFKPASWKSPNKNFIRGNVLSNRYAVSIYGI